MEEPMNETRAVGDPRKEVLPLKQEDSKAGVT